MQIVKLKYSGISAKSRLRTADILFPFYHNITGENVHRNEMKQHYFMETLMKDKIIIF